MVYRHSLLEIAERGLSRLLVNLVRHISFYAPLAFWTLIDVSSAKAIHLQQHDFSFLGAMANGPLRGQGRGGIAFGIIRFLTGFFGLHFRNRLGVPLSPPSRNRFAEYREKYCDKNSNNCQSDFHLFTRQIRAADEFVLANWHWKALGRRYRC